MINWGSFGILENTFNKDVIEKVKDIIQDYLKKNRYFEVEKIIPIIISRFGKSSTKLNKTGIIKIIEYLVEKKLVVEGSKLTKGDVLLNSNRKRIYLYIKNNPGIYFNALAKQLNIRFNVLEWHLNMLLKFKFIRKEYVNGIGIYFNRDLKFETAKIFHFISKEKIKKIIFYLKIHNTGTTKTKLRKDLQMHHSTIKKYLEELEEYNLITKEHKDNKYYFFLKDDIFNCISSKVSKAKSGKEVI